MISCAVYRFYISSIIFIIFHSIRLRVHLSCVQLCWLGYSLADFTFFDDCVQYRAMFSNQKDVTVASTDIVLSVRLPTIAVHDC